jgi:hypothetical protein
MAIVSTDLIAYAALSRPEDDVSTTGGAIDPDTRAALTQLAANSEIQALSDSSADTTPVLTVVGRKADGSIATATVTLNGTTAVTLTPSTTFERVLKAYIDRDAVGKVTVRRVTGAVLIGEIPAGERGFVALFQRAISEASQTIRYEKIFWKNAHATLALNNAAVMLTADPSSKIRIGLAAAKGDSATIANRKTAPGGITFSDDNVSLSVPTGGMAAGEAIGVWIEETLAAADAPVRSTFNTQLTGDSA